MQGIFPRRYLHFFVLVDLLIVLLNFVCLLAVGLNGQNNLVHCGGDLDQAKSVFEKK